MATTQCKNEISSEQLFGEEFDILSNYLEIETILCDIELSAMDIEPSDDVTSGTGGVCTKKLYSRSVCLFLCHLGNAF